MNIIGIICKIKKHKWKNGSCVRCGVEHAPHEWAPQPGLCEEKCVICGKIQKIKHNFSNRGGCEYICTNCGERQLMHDFVPNVGCHEVCSRCGAERISHKWNTVRKKRRNGEVAVLAGCRCTVCGAPNPEGSHAFSTREENGRRYRICLVCGFVTELSAQASASDSATVEVQIRNVGQDM